MLRFFFFFFFKCSFCFPFFVSPTPTHPACPRCLGFSFILSVSLLICCDDKDLAVPVGTKKMSGITWTCKDLNYLYLLTDYPTTYQQDAVVGCGVAWDTVHIYTDPTSKVVCYYKKYKTLGISRYIVMIHVKRFYFKLFLPARPDLLSPRFQSCKMLFRTNLRSSVLSR